MRSLFQEMPPNEALSPILRLDAASRREADLATSVASASPVQKPNATAVEPAAGSDFEQRLVIEEDPQSGAFVYKTVDRITGEVISQLPREDVLRLKDDPAYRAGSVVAARA